MNILYFEISGLDFLSAFGLGGTPPTGQTAQCLSNAWSHLQFFPLVLPLVRAGIRLPRPMGLVLVLAPTDHACFSLAPPAALPACIEASPVI